MDANKAERLVRAKERTADVGRLLLRVAAAALMIDHGLGKVERWDPLVTDFADPIGLGPATSLVLAIFAEVVCSVAVGLGALTRLAALPPLVTMLVAALVVHATDPFARKELPLLYAAVYASIALLGPGRYSLDGVFAAARSRRERTSP